MLHRPLLASALLLLAATAQAATFTVDTTDDFNDASPGDGQCASAASNCTLRAAIQEINALGEPANTIRFNIPGGGTWNGIYPQYAGLPDITVPVTIDGTTQPGSQPNTLPVGTNAIVAVGIDGGDAGSAPGLVFKPGSGGSEVRGLRVTGFQGGGIVIDGEGQPGSVNDILLRGNFIGTDGSGAGNDVNGGAANGQHGIYVTGGAGDTAIGGGGLAGRNLIVGDALGSAVTVAWGAHGAQVIDNLIGTNRAGTQRHATQVGVLLEEAARTALVLGNTIGAAHTGVLIRHGGFDPQGDAHAIRGNRIGIGPGGENIAGSEDGVHITNAGRSATMPWNNAIGGAAQDQGNTIAHWGRNGVRIARLNDPAAPASPRNTILGNSIFGNGALGIELIDITVIPPLGGQPQEPPPAAINGGQAAPAITSALVGGGGVQLAYQLSGPPGQAYFIEVFTNSACDASGYGEGQTLLTRINLPDASGGQHTAQLQPLLPGTVLTLTATAQQGQSPTGGTSEFSRCLAVGQTAGGGNPQPGQPGIAPVPTLGHAALALLSVFVGGLGLHMRRRNS